MGALKRSIQGALRYFLGDENLFVWDAYYADHTHMEFALQDAGYHITTAYCMGLIRNLQEARAIAGNLKQAQTKKVKQGEYSAIMAVVPHDISQEIVEWGVRNIKDKDVFSDEEVPRLGRELEPHITVKYGLFTDDVKSVRQFFNNAKPFKAKLGKVKHFEPPEMDFDVVTVEVVSEDLESMNKEVTEHFECAEGLVSDEYHPHITISYVERGKGKDYIGSSEFEGKEITLDTLIVSPRKGNRTYFSISQDKESRFVLEKLNKFSSMDLGLWVDPQGIIYDVHGEGLVHNEWVSANLDLLKTKYGLKIPQYLYDEVTEYFNSIQEGFENVDNPDTSEVWVQMIQSGWTRIGDSDEGIGVEVNYLQNIPFYLDSILVEYLTDGMMIRVEDINHTMISVQYPFKSLQQAVNKALRSPTKTASGKLIKLTDCRYAIEAGVFEDATEMAQYIENNPNGYIPEKNLYWKYNPTTDIHTFYTLQNKQASGNNFYPSLVQAPNNEWQFEYGGDDQEIPVDPDAVSDEETFYAPCTVGKPRNPDMWRQLWHMIKSPFSKKEVESASDPEQEAIEQKELGGETLLEYSKGFKDLNQLNTNKPKTTWPDNSSSQGGEPYAPLPSFHVETNPDNENWRWPYKFTSRPRGEDSDDGKTIEMLREREKRKACIEKMTRDITSDIGDKSGYFISPEGKILKMDDEYGHSGFIADLYGRGLTLEEVNKKLEEMFNNGWTRIREGDYEVNVEIADARNISPHVEQFLDRYPDNIELIIQDHKNKNITLFMEDIHKGLQQAVNKALQRKRLGKKAGTYSASVPDYQGEQYYDEQHMNDTDCEPYVNHDQRDTSWGYHDSPENTDSGIGWAKDNSPQTVFLDVLNKPFDRTYPGGMAWYSVVLYDSLPMSNGIESVNPD